MFTRDFKFENGDLVRDIITEQEGVITGTCFYITGCNQYLVAQKQIDKSREPLSAWRDEGRLVLIESKAIVLEDSNLDDGPDLPAPIK